MTLELTFLLFTLHVVDLDRGIFTSNEDINVAFIEDSIISRGETSVEITHFLHHTDVPHSHHSI